MSQTPVFVMNTAPERQSGRKAQISNITAAKVRLPPYLLSKSNTTKNRDGDVQTVADVIRTCLGPKAMLKMILDPMGGILLTNDGNAILREIDVAHPAAKNMIELSRTQDEECGDGTTSVIILAGEILAQSLSQLERDIHPVVIISAYNKALSEALSIIQRISVPIDTSSDTEMLSLIKTSIGTKFVARWSDMMCKLALQAVRTVAVSHGAGEGGQGHASGQTSVDIKRYARVEKIPGGEIEESRVLSGVLLNKDITHPAMRRRIANPRIILLDCPLEYKKGESQTNMEFSKEGDWARAQEIEEEQVKQLCEKLLELKPDLVVTEKGVSDLAQHVFAQANVSALRRVRKSDNNRIALAVGATIVNRIEDIREADVGTGCGLFKVEKIGDEYFTFLTECRAPKACTILLRGPSKDILNEIDRNLADAMSVARNAFFNPTLCPGGGATEMAISVGLQQKARSGAVQGVETWPYRAVADAMEVIPRVLIQNSGGNVIRVLTELRAKHANGEHSWGVNGDTGKIVDMKEYGLYESASVKIQTLKTAIEAARMLLRVDDVVQAVRKEQEGGGGGAGAPPEEMMEAQ
ncbi:hypothetical protein CVT25_009770 [Psilocybe cyanescens]|uniref:T-complex protein 1 subunit gamma n=1 Tax=Psilocybe cyanescens TaxID=93625 RepID=A0A409XPZ6_PSICY|nr:hypothetical protein CVT25_009770 [Psilocybe cyanescens]